MLFIGNVLHVAWLIIQIVRVGCASLVALDYIPFDLQHSG